MSQKTKTVFETVFETVGVKHGIAGETLSLKLSQMDDLLTGNETEEEGNEILFNFFTSGKFNINELALLVLMNAETGVELSEENRELKKNLSKTVALESIEPIDHSVKEDNKIAGINVQVVGLKHINLLNQLEAQGVDFINEPSKIVEILEKNMSKRELAVSFVVTMLHNVREVNPLARLLQALSK